MTTFENYKDEFIYLVGKKEDNIEEIKKLLNYLEGLKTKNLPIIFDVVHFGSLVGYGSGYILGATNSPYKYYRKFKIPKKKKGEYREILEPLSGLKDIQTWILKNILEKNSLNPYVKSYVKDKGIKDNAKFHRQQKFLLKLDIKNYFPSFKFKKVYNYFLDLGYTKQVAILLSKLCYYNGLPQGAPTSPLLSNLLTNRLDERISSFCKGKRIRYTRYADDLTFSGEFEIGMIVNFVKKILMQEGFKLNADKIKVARKNQSQRVTGIVVNEKMQAPREFRKRIRQEIYYIKNYGLENHLERLKKLEEKFFYVDKLIGKCNFVLYVNSKDEEVTGYRNYLKDNYKEIINS
ncbi:reverse transcriptase family protein [Fusobacterium sp. MFO224]|uniref:reverse transcriptase family protein n=1 Tax=Fusobacterium sp. MFO224 TaxID=3378070 RepID=UPI003853BD19